MNEIQLRVLIWDICTNDRKLRDVLTTGDIYSIQDLAIKMAKESSIYPLEQEN